MDMISQMALRNWKSLVTVLPKLTEIQLQQMIDHETANEKRISYAVRVHQRLVNMRNTREREEIISACNVKT